MEYSKNIKRNVEKIYNYYEENDDFKFLQKIIHFIVDGIDYIDEQYLMMPKENIQYFISEAIKIWEKDGSQIELNKIGLEYDKRIKPFKEMKRKEYAAWGCIKSVLYNGHDDPVNQFVYDFIELEVDRFEILEIEEKTIEQLLKKYFNDIIV